MSARNSMPSPDTSQATIPHEIIILAMGPTRFQCPYDAEVWAVNNGYKQVREAGGHLDKLFLAHIQVKDSEGNDMFNWEEINGLGVEVINTHRVKGLKSRLFPMERIATKLGCGYFSDTICYILAYAIDKATVKKKGKLELLYPLKLRLYGADMHTQDEYDKEKGGIEYWIGFARGLGIEVEISRGSMVCKTYNGAPYGVKATRPTIASELFEACAEDFLKPSTGEVFIGFVDENVINGIM